MNLRTGYPFWLINSGLPANYPKLEQAIKTDVVIIGGGISGALTAYHLINAGINCIVVDARTIGLGSTCASTSLLQYEIDKPLSKLSLQIGIKAASQAYHLCSNAIDNIKKIASEIHYPDFEKHNSLFFAAFKKDVQLLKDEYSVRKKAGFDVSYLDADALKKQYNFDAPAAILSAKGATIDAYLFTHALHKASIKKGLQVFDRTAVSNIEYFKNGTKLTCENGCVIRSKKIVNASGYEIKEFIDKKIVKLTSTYAIASENIHSPNPVWKDKTLLWNTADPYLYMRLTKDNRVIIGGRDEDFFSPNKRDQLIKKKTALLTKDFLKLFPSVNFIPEYSWAGTFGSTKDALPYIGLYDKTPHTYYALGFGGNGITFSVIAAQIIRDLIIGKKNSNTALFSFSR